MKTNSIQFRLAEAGDLPELNRISLASKRYWGYPDDWLEHWKDELTVTKKQLREQYVLLAENEAQVIGFIAIAQNEDHYEILHLWISPEHIGKGCGRSLLRSALNTYCQAVQPVMVTADPNAEAFYRKEGFQTVGRVASYPPGRMLPVMKK